MTGLTTANAAANAMVVDAWSAGDGPPLLFLHGEPGLLFCEPFLQRLSERFAVLAPLHPGWGDSARRPTDRTIDDLSYHYLDVLETFGEPAVVVGCSLGAWLALEIATKDESRIAALALVSPVGIRSGEPTKRHYLDRYAASAEQLAAALYGAPHRTPDLSARSDDELLGLARAEEATAFYTWQPYLHNPSLLARLHRVRRPTLLVGGAQDGFILAADHLDTLRAALGAGGRTHVVAEAGHRVEEQCPDELAEQISRFVADPAAVGR